MEPSKPKKIPRPESDLPKTDKPVVRPTLERVISSRVDSRASSVAFDNAVLMNMGEGMYTVDLNGSVTSMNRTAETLLGWTFNELAGLNMHNATHYKHRNGTPFPAEECAGSQVLQHGRSLKDHDDVFIRKDGSFFDVIYSSSPIREDGEITGLVVVFRDVTERNQTLAALRESEERYRILTETASDAIIRIDEDSTIQFVNSAATRIFGYSEAEMTGQSLTMLMPEPMREQHRKGFGHYLSTGIRKLNWASIEVPARHKDGREFPLEISFGEYDQDGTRFFIGIARDISERKQGDEALLERVRLAALRTDISSVLVSGQTLSAVLQHCAAALVKHLDAAFARVWTLNEAENVLEMQASAGIYEHLNGPHGRVKMGEFKIGRIAQSGQPFLTNDVQHDPNISDPEWAKHQDVVAFAGYPLMLEGRVLGVMAMFARHTLSETVLDELGLIADGIAQWIRRKAAEEGLRASETNLRNLADTIPQLAWMAEPDGNIFWFNRGWHEYTGKTLEQMQGWGWESVHDPKILPKVVKRWKVSLATAEPFEMEFPLKRADGNFRWFLTRVKPLRDSEGRIVRWFGTNTDITERRQSQLNAEFWASVSDDLNQIADTDEMIHSVTAKIGAYMNLSVCSFVYIDETENTATISHDWHRPDVPGLVGVYPLSDYLANEFQKTLRGGESFIIHDTAIDPRITKTESYEGLKIRSFIVAPAVESGQWRFSVGMYDSSPRDWRSDEIEMAGHLTDRIWARLERDRSEQAVRESEARFSLAQEAGNVGVWDWNVATDLTYWSQTMWRIYDANPHDGNPDEAFWLSHIHPNDRNRAKLSIKERLDSTHDRHTDMFRIIQKSGGIKWIESIATIERDESGKPVRMYGVDLDITDRKNIEERIRRRETQLRVITNSVPGLISYVDKDRRFRFVNHQYSVWFGKPENEIIGVHMRDLLGVKTYRILKPKVEQVFAGEECSIETLVHYPKAGVRFVQFSYTPDFADDGAVRGFYLLVTDLTDRKLAEDKLRTSEERMRVLMWSLTEHAILSIDLEGKIDGWNRGAQLIFGYEPEDIMGSSIERLFTPEDVALGIHLKEMGGSRQKGHAADDRWHIRKDGSRFFASGEMTPVYVGKSLIGYAKIVRDLTETKRIADQLQRAHDDLELRVAARTKDMTDANILLLQQMKERAFAEEQRLGLLRRLFTVQEDERARIARDIHDQLGQRLTALRLKIASLKDMSIQDQAVVMLINRLQEIGEHLDSEVSFLAWELRPSILDNVDFVKALENYVSEWSRYSDIFAEFEAIGVRNVEIDADLEINLYRITQEALNNAAKHAKADQINVLLEKRDDQLILIIEDNGVGFDTTVINHDRDKGKGFGLFGMRERAAIISGTIEIESSENKGTSIFVRVPLA